MNPDRVILHALSRLWQLSEILEVFALLMWGFSEYMGGLDILGVL